MGATTKKGFNELETFLEWVEVLPLTTAMSAKAVELFEAYCLSHDVKIADMLIASTALTYDVKLVSKNQKDFRFIEELKLVK